MNICRMPCISLLASQLVALLSLTTHATSAADAVPTAADVEFFENRVRPVLVEQCLMCHGEKKQQGGLSLHTRDAMMKGNDSGPSVVAGKPNDSRLIQVIRYSKDDIQMPPKGKLSDEQIADLTRWVEHGAIWPGDVSKAVGQKVASANDKHWAFQPIQNPPLPELADQSRVRDPLDAFILSSLGKAGLTLAPAADRATFIRRATLDLWGIPPTYEAVQAYVHDSSPDATARLIDRLLESPLYGERWGRHWLDIARYADTKGYVFTDEPRYPYSYTYRDYVIESLNADKPYDRFILEQIAADQLDLGDEQTELAALGFLTVGRRFLNKQEDIIDDRIDVVTRGLMSITVGCARCHDHKYDPIPTADYYSLYGVFNSSVEPGELPMIGEPKAKEAYVQFQQELAKREGALNKHSEETLLAIQAMARKTVGAYLLLLIDPKGATPNESKAQAKAEPRQHIVQRWREFLAKREKGADAVFGPWHVLRRVKPEDLPGKIASLMTEYASPEFPVDGDQRVNLLVRQAFVEQSPETLEQVAKLYGDLFAETEVRWASDRAKQPDLTAFVDPVEEELRQILYGEGAPPNLPLADVSKAFQRDERDKNRQLAKQIENLKATSPGAPPRAMVLNDRDRPIEPRIFIRGSIGRQGDQVPRQFLKVVQGPDRKPFTKGSGRLELAQAIVARDNPLTSRVLVNRVWQHHFGYGLSRNPGDFGIRGEVPTHPELLDHLATRFMDGGWSLKQLHRWIMNSSTYQQSSQDSATARSIDPENRLYWRMPRQRLEFEALRDSWLAVAGRLDLSMGGRAFENVTDANSPRRTIYAFINRNDLPNVFRSFDFADVDVSAPLRPQTTVPQQALFAMNSPFLLEQAHQLAEATRAAKNPSERIIQLFRRALSRDPQSIELAEALDFVSQIEDGGQSVDALRVQNVPEKRPLSAWDQLAQTLMLTNEFLFVD